jgi:hypothetical protein
VPAAVTQLLTIAPVPTGGTIEGLDILCGTKGSICSVKHPEGVPVELHPTADPGFTFMGFLGDCAPLGHTQMTGPRVCGATFSPTAVAQAVPVRPPPTPPRSVREDRSGGAVAPPPPRTQSAPPTSPRTQSAPSTAASPSASGTPIVSPTAPDPKQVAPPPTDEEFAKRMIQNLLKEYCAAHEAVDPAAVQRVYPKVNMASLQNQLNKSKYRSVQCKFADPEFVTLDPAAGTATIKVEVKRVYEHTAVKEKPHSDEIRAEMRLSRPGPRSPWFIDTVKYTEIKK